MDSYSTPAQGDPEGAKPAVSMLVRMSPELAAWIRATAKAENRSMTSVINGAVENERRRGDRAVLEQDLDAFAALVGNLPDVDGRWLALLRVVRHLSGRKFGWGGAL